MTNMGKVEALVCPECGGRFSRTDLTDGDDIVTCENCGRKYPTVEILRKSDGVLSEKIRADVYREVELDKAQLQYKAEIARIEAEREQLQADREIERERLRASSEAERARRRMEERQEKREYKRNRREEARESGTRIFRAIRPALPILGGILLIIAIILFFMFMSMREEADNRKNETEIIAWESLALGENLPAIDSDKGEVVWNNQDSFLVYIYEMDLENFHSYVSRCATFGYVIEAVRDGNEYCAYNENGYYLDLNYWEGTDEQYISIALDRPKKNEQIIWPNSGLAKKLPVPKSMLGEIVSETSESFSVYITNVEKSYFSEYVALCMEKGFDEDYQKEDDYFTAKKWWGPTVTVRYEGFNTIYIHISE